MLCIVFTRLAVSFDMLITVSLYSPDVVLSSTLFSVKVAPVMISSIVFLERVILTPLKVNSAFCALASFLPAFAPVPASSVKTPSASGAVVLKPKSLNKLFSFTFPAILNFIALSLPVSFV